MRLMQKKSPDNRPPLRIISNNAGKPAKPNRFNFNQGHTEVPVSRTEISITEDDLFIPEMGRHIDPDQDGQEDHPPHNLDHNQQWRWVLVAHLSLETPLRALKRHGETMAMTKEAGEPSEPEIPAVDSPYLCWVPAGINGTNTHGDPAIDSPESVTMDIHPNETSPLRYRKFLVYLRSILEAPETPTWKREAITRFVNDDQWMDVVSIWGSLDDLLDRLIPPFLTALKTHLGIPQNVVDTLKTIGIVSRIDLIRALKCGFPGIGSLESLNGIGPATVCRLQHYYLNEDKLDEKTKTILGDPYMQTVF